MFRAISLLLAFGFGLRLLATVNDCSDSQLLGSWIDLSTLNTLELEKDCTFKKIQGKCRYQGILKRNKMGSFFEFKESLPKDLCTELGEKYCTFKSLSNLLTLGCPPHLPQHFVRADLEFIRKSGFSEHEKTLVLIKNESFDILEKHLEKLSHQGHSEAIAARGYLYLLELYSFPRKYDLSLKLNQKAGEEHYITSQTLLGIQYLYGLGTEASFEKAEAAFIQSANQNDVIAQKALAGMYLAHTDSSKYRPLAFQWLERASQQGDEQARLYLQAIRGPVEEIRERAPSSLTKPSDPKPN